MKTVCDQCGSEFPSLFKDNNTQAMGCAADIFDYKGKLAMLGHYGSRLIDGSLYLVLTGNYKKGIICDACVQKGMDADHFRSVSHSNYFGIN